jgi:hypothetical protein
MDRLQLARLRDYAMDYLPEAQKVREQEKTRTIDFGDSRDERSISYARRLWNVADAIISSTESTGVELTAAMLLLSVTSWEAFEPHPGLDKMATARSGKDTKVTRDDMLPGIANAVETLNNITGRNVQFASPLVPFVDSVSDGAITKQESEQVGLSLNDAVRIDEAAKLIGCTVESLLREAANSERLLYVALKPHLSKLVAIPSHPSPRKSTNRSDGGIVAMLPNYAESLAIFGSVDIKQYQASFEEGSLLDWHYWMLDEPQTVGLDRVFFSRAHLIPVDAHVETLGFVGAGNNTVTEPENVKDEANNHGDTTPNERENQLHTLIWRVRLHLIQTKGKATAPQIWNEIRHRHTEHDTDEIIQEVTADLILWKSFHGNEPRFKKSSLSPTITKLKKKPPF